MLCVCVCVLSALYADVCASAASLQIAEDQKTLREGCDRNSELSAGLTCEFVSSSPS